VVRSCGPGGTCRLNIADCSVDNLKGLGNEESIIIFGNSIRFLVNSFLETIC
jgi:hypothetical protein